MVLNPKVRFLRLMLKRRRFARRSGKERDAVGIAFSAGYIMRSLHTQKVIGSELRFATKTLHAIDKKRCKGVISKPLKGRSRLFLHLFRHDFMSTVDKFGVHERVLGERHKGRPRPPLMIRRQRVQQWRGEDRNPRW